MEEQFDSEWDAPIDVEQFYPPDDPGYICFRCGICCRLWVFVTGEEADRIAARVKLNRPDFTIEYWDQSVSPEECLVLRQKDGACVFLRGNTHTPEKGCAIYDLRPRVCRDFLPSLLCKECQKGLKQHWNLTATTTGRVEGTDKNRQTFFAYLKKIAFGGI
jgi:Fe-S-cluster containining protein